VVRPQIPHVPSWVVIVISVVLALVPAAVNLLSGRETGLRLEEIPSRRQTVELLVDAAVILALVAVFCLAAPHSDTFALLLLPQHGAVAARRGDPRTHRAAPGQAPARVAGTAPRRCVPGAA
jgi:hypothetical protein